MDTPAAFVVPPLGSFFAPKAGADFPNYSVSEGGPDFPVYFRVVSANPDNDTCSLQPYFRHPGGVMVPGKPVGAGFPFSNVEGAWNFELAAKLIPVPVLSRALDIPGDWTAFSVVRNRPGMSVEPLDYLVEVPPLADCLVLDSSDFLYAGTGGSGLSDLPGNGDFLWISPDGFLRFDSSDLFDKNPDLERVGFFPVSLVRMDLGFSEVPVDAPPSPDLWVPENQTSQGVGGLLSKVEGLFGRDSLAASRLRERLDAVMPEPVFEFVPLSENGSVVQFDSPDIVGFGIYGVSGPVGPTLRLPSVHEGKPVISVVNHAFEKQAGLVSVTIPEGYLSVGVGAFRQCERLQNVVLPDSLDQIRADAFSECSLLEVPEFGSRLSRIGSDAFRGCFRNPDDVSTTRALVLPEGLTELGDSAFEGSGLRAVSLPASLTSVGSYAFEGCDRLKEVDLPVNLKSLGDAVFKGCSSLWRISLPSSLVSMGRSVFEGCASLVSLALPNGLSSVPDRTFSGCKNLVGLTFPGQDLMHNPPGAGFVSVIGDHAFRGCESLRSINLPVIGRPVGKAEIPLGKGAFEGCRFLSEVRLPASLHPYTFVECIDAPSVFAGCSQLAVISNGAHILRKGDRAVSRKNDAALSI